MTGPAVVGSGAGSLLAPWGHRPALDGLRTIAVYLVVAFHAGLARFSGGFIGVDLFFVLSGYLVTTVLWNDYKNHGRIRLAHFYSRRARRLVPAALIAIVGTAVLMLLVSNALNRSELIDDARAAALWFANWHFASESSDYFASAVEQSPYLHYWSLSIEEQFYVLFPMALWGMARVSRGQDSIVVASVGLLAGLSLFAQFVLSGNVSRAYYGTDTRGYQLLVGAVLALAFDGMRRANRPISRSLKQVAPAATAGAVVAFVVLATNVFDIGVGTRGVFAAALSIVVVAGLELGGNNPVATVLGSASMTYLGRISYGTYLWHWPLIVAFRLVYPDVSSIIVFGFAALFATALAAFSYEIFEMPLRRGRTSLPYVPVTAVALGFSLIVAFAVPVMLESPRKPPLGVAGNTQVAAQPVDAATPSQQQDQEADQDQPAQSVATDSGDRTNNATDDASTDGSDETAPVIGETGPVAVPDVGALTAIRDARVPEPVHCGSNEIQVCTRQPNGEPRVLLLGDSSARLLIPALDKLAAERGFAFYLNTMPGCPWQEGVYTTDPRWDALCAKTQGGTYQGLLESVKPDLVLTFELGRLEPEVEDFLFYTGEKDDRYRGLSAEQVLERSTLDSAERILAESGKLLMIEPVPLPPFEPLECLSSVDDARDCTFVHPYPVPPTEAIFRRIAGSDDRISTLDIDLLSCPNYPTCELIRDDSVVYRDSLHVWQDYYLKHRNRIWQQLDRHLGP